MHILASGALLPGAGHLTRAQHAAGHGFALDRLVRDGGKTLLFGTGRVALRREQAEAE